MKKNTPMRIIYAIVLLLASTTISIAQIQLGPLQGNTILRNAYAQELATEKSTLSPLEKTVDCPPNIFITNALDAGSDLLVNVDTIGTRIGGDSLTLTALIDCTMLQFGTLTVPNDTAAQVLYTANAGIETASDTACIRICGITNDAMTECDTILVPFFVKRPGQGYFVTGPTLEAQATDESFCVDEGLLPGTLSCAQIIDCEDEYDGEGEQNINLTDFVDPVACVRYRAARFPGQDTVCLVLCDDNTICDTFRIVYTITKDVAELPFFEDFSNNQGSSYPSAERWLDRNVFINNTLAPNPPSVGMATFDGLDKTGSEYTTLGAADYLTSNRINLDGQTAGSNVYFKCYVAAKGYGLYPNADDDLVLEFRNEDREWEEINRWEGFDYSAPSDTLPEFEFYSVKIEDNRFLHPEFQFRFVGYSAPAGIYDLWHLDYISVDANDNENPEVNDMAFTLPARSILKRYATMPWTHLQNHVDTEFGLDSLISGYFNHRNVTSNVTESGVVLTEKTTGQTATNSTLTLFDETDATANNMPSLEPAIRRKVVADNLVGNYTGLLNALPAGDVFMDLEVEYNLAAGTQEPNRLVNDTVRFNMPLHNYFAYDDGTAENVLFFSNPQNNNPEIAMRFDANIDDNIRAIQLHFPHFSGDVSGQLFNLRIWIGDGVASAQSILDEDPVWEGEFLQPIYPDVQFDTLQGFTTYRVQDALGELTPVEVKAGQSFFIGFQQVSITEEGIPLGFDFQYDARENTYIRIANSWDNIPNNFAGATMIRPVVGATTPGNTAVEDAPQMSFSPFHIYPNPTSDVLQLQLKDGNYQDYEVAIFSNTGQLMARQPLDNQLNMSEYAQGVYHLQLKNKKTNATYHERVVVLR